MLVDGLAAFGVMPGKKTYSTGVRSESIESQSDFDAESSRYS